MVCSDRGRRDAPDRAVRCAVPPALARVLAIGGLAAAGWLCAGVGEAFADDAFPNELETVTAKAEEGSAPTTTTAAPAGDGGASASPVGVPLPPVERAVAAVDRIVGPPEGDGPLTAAVPTLVEHVDAQVGRVADAVHRPTGGTFAAGAAAEPPQPPSAPAAEDAGTAADPAEPAAPAAGSPPAAAPDAPAAPGGSPCDASAPAETGRGTPAPPVPSFDESPKSGAGDPATAGSPSPPPHPTTVGCLTQRIEPPNPATARLRHPGGPVARADGAADAPPSPPD